MRALIVALAIYLGAFGAARTDDQKRVALVIGNDDYGDSTTEVSAEIEALAGTLRNIGFDSVTVKRNLKKDEMVVAAKEFSIFAAQSDIALIYFSGQGVELNGQKLLFPSGARVESAQDAEAEGISLDGVLNLLDAPKTYRIVVVDVCRSNRLLSKQGTSIYCLGHAESVANSTIVMAPNKGSKGGKGSGLGFAMAKVLTEPGLDVSSVLSKVSDEVKRETHEDYTVQWYRSAANGRHYLFNLDRYDQKALGIEPDEAAWGFLRGSNDREKLQRFVDSYPASRFRKEAEEKILCLREDEGLARKFQDSGTKRFAVALANLQRAERDIADVCKQRPKVVTGAITKIFPCYNNAIYFELGSVGKDNGFVWTEHTKIGRWGRPRSVGRRLIALPGMAYYCVKEVYPLTVVPGIHLNALRISDEHD